MIESFVVWQSGSRARRLAVYDAVVQWTSHHTMYLLFITVLVFVCLPAATRGFPRFGKQEKACLVVGMDMVHPWVIT